ncbi:MAG: TonB-dependent receptor plug domain-containing protein, partial [Alphaproteobacteria bacterium]|nr:TonB-dependent receptor plug domain-containing protein [Alphaproteobacteria bacterium]
MKNIQLSALAGVCLSASLMAPALAQEVDEIIVSATGIPTPAAQIGASVDVLTAEDLENQQVIYLQDALKLKGINIPQSGGIGTLSNVFLRGLPGKYTDLVIDGISLYDPRSEQVLWQDITTDGVEQVEILRGSQGVLFGSNTIAGVVSQFTKLGGETENRIRLEAGELSTQKLSMKGNGARGDVDY